MDDVTSSLFDRRGDGDRNLVQIGQGDDLQLALAYLQAADLLAANSASNHRLVLPIIGNYRHGIELALKAVIREAAECGRRDGLVDTDLDPGNLNQSLIQTHQIGKLVQKLDGFLARLSVHNDLVNIDNDSREILDSLHNLDHSGQTFRYSTVKVGKGKHRKLALARPGLTEVDVNAVAEALHDAGWIILDKVGEALYYYEQWQLDRVDQ